MAAGMARLSIIGHLGHDPEVRYSQSGIAMSNLRVATTERRKEGDNWIDHTQWITVICFGKTAELAGEYLKKGRQIYAEGRFQSSTWEDREGKTRFSPELVASQLVFLSGAREGESDLPGQGEQSKTMPSSSDSKASNASSPPTPTSNPAAGGGFVEEDDVPF